MLKYGLSAALLIAAVPAFAQPGQGGPTPPPEFIQAAQAFGNCLRAGAGQVAASVTPEAGATQVVAGCAAQRTEIEARFEAWVASPGFPEAGRAIAREQFRTQIAGVEGQIAEGIRSARSGSAPAGHTGH